ncbi:MAG: universal stress protein [Lentisphaerota bacterium]
MKKILVPIDFSDVTDLVVENAKSFAKALNAEVKIIHVVPVLQEVNLQAARGVGGVFVEPLNYGTIRDGIAGELKNEHKTLHDIKDQLTRENLKVKTSFIEGKATEVILSQIKEYAPDMIIIGSHGHGYLKKVLLGSIAMFVLKHAQCPVIIVPRHEHKK